MASKKPATKRMKRFAEAYTGEALFRGAESARIAGFSRESAGRIAVRLLKDPRVQRLINRRLAKYAMSSDEAMARLSAMGRGTLAPFLAEVQQGDETYVEVDLSSDDAKANIHLVKKIKQTKVRRITGRGEEKEIEEELKTEIELHDAKDATVQMAKIRGLYGRDENGDPLVPQYKVYVGVDPEKV